MFRDVQGCWNSAAETQFLAGPGSAPPPKPKPKEGTNPLEANTWVFVPLRLPATCPLYKDSVLLRSSG